MNILLYVNYLLKAEALQPESSSNEYTFYKLYWNLWDGWYFMYLMSDKRCRE